MSISKTIEELVKGGQECGPATAFLNCLTLNGKIDERDALKGLSGRERAIFNVLLESSIDYHSPETEFVLSMRPYGRVSVLPAEEYTLSENALTEVTRFTLQDKHIDQIRKAQQADILLLQAGLAVLTEFYETEGYVQIADRLNSAVKNMAPLIFYIGDKCFSNFYNVGKGDVPWEYEIHAALTHLKQEQSNASVSVQTLAFCLDLLMRSGTYTRAEELNSCQLNVETLQAHFLRAFDHYRSITAKACITRNEFASLPLPEQSNMLASLRAAMQQFGVFVRDINGLNLLKKERYFKDGIEDPELAREQKEEHARRLVEHIISEHTGEIFRWSEDAISGFVVGDSGILGDHPFDSDVEYLIDLIIKAAIHVTASDVGMSRGVRDLAKFTQTWLRQDTVESCEWTQAEYYCHAVASPELMQMLPAKKIIVLINAVSSRMRYNAWHYTPSYFIVEKIPESRGWFHAPRMADIAEWSDHHHAGHVHAAVRYSIRSPKLIRIKGEIFYGLTDLRLMRQAGRRYTLSDLAAAIQYTDALGFVYQQLVNNVTDGTHRFEFKFGSKAWIDAHYAALASEAAMVG
jgi:hypothetical protein